MIHNRKLSKNVNKVHERTLMIVYGDHTARFSKLLDIDKSATIHKKTCNIYLLKSVKLERVSLQ